MKHQEGLSIIRMCSRFAAVGLLIGSLLFCISLFVNAYSISNPLFIFGLGLMGASMTFFGFGLFLGIFVGISDIHVDK